MHDQTTPDGPPARRGDLLLFGLYCLLYGGFVSLAAFRSDLMAMLVLGGVNLAIAYGVGLIVAAILLAGIAMCTERRTDRPS